MIASRRCRAFSVVLLGLFALAADKPVDEVPSAPRPTAPLKALRLFPETIELDGPRAEQWVGVLGEFADGSQRDLRREATYSVSGPAAKVGPTGIVLAAQDGKAQLTVKVGGVSRTVPIEVKNAADAPVSFSREVVPVLTRGGCNQGACHGAQHGRGGFKLSLFGFDPQFDHEQILYTAEGRRVVLSDPDRSPLLLKPVLALEHGGGERFGVASREYEVIRRWLEDGAPAPTAKDPHVAGLSVWPAHRILVPGERQQIQVTATWSDGKREDVTAIAQFDALNDAVAAVSPEGLVTAKGKGETYVMVRFAGQATVAQVTLPFAKLSQPLAFPPANFIDEKLAVKWTELGLAPSAGCSDEEFLRRVHLDAIGTLPTPAEVRAFLADRAPDKRARLVDRLLDRPEFVDFWALKWGDLLRINRSTLQEKGMWSFHNWVRAKLRENTPVDAMVREIITAEGSTAAAGPANFFRVGVATDWSETVTQLFLGIRLQCAKCHHHPFEKWSQDDYYGMAAFFSRLGTKRSQEFDLFSSETVVFLRPTGEQSHPRKGGVVKPRPLDGEESDDAFDRRQALARWLTAPDNPMFSRNIVNRVWSYTMGRGLTEPVDDMRATNPPSIPTLLDALADDFAKNKFDLKHLLRTIFASRAYQLSSETSDANRADAANVFHTRYTRKRLTAEQLADALDHVTGTREKYPGLPLGTRAIQLPDTKVRSFLLDVFGRPPRQITCECERTTQPNIAQALHLLNGDFLNTKIDAPTGRIGTLLKAKASPDSLIDDLYLAALCRLPRDEERTRAQRWLTEASTLKDGAADLLWVLVNSREFLFNH